MMASSDPPRKSYRSGAAPGRRKMGTRALISAIIVSFFVAGCGQMMRGDGNIRAAHKEKANQCDGTGVCKVDVKLSPDGTKIVVEPDYVIVNNKRKPIE